MIDEKLDAVAVDGLLCYEDVVKKVSWTIKDQELLT